MFDDTVHDLASRTLESCRRKGLMIVTAESCTGGLIAGALTAIPGSSDVVDRGYVTYSYDAKTEMLGVPSAMIMEHGAVSEEVARAMVSGVLRHSPNRVGVAVTGVAGPGSDSQAKPAGLVHMAAGTADRMLHRVERYGDIGRDAMRHATVNDALALVLDLLD
ncbi:MAG: damage-inducible protein CinA [Rhodospirillaceae bacterium]|nr:damage-inducible protein CinA [Rhodospirillaceae bacterium]|tara:strand:- start:2576 stop:3064 length:489 start_codon:yes stop_codon:yes gene_type:complete